MLASSFVQTVNQRLIVHGPDKASLLPLQADFPLGVTGALWTDEGCQAVIAQIQQHTQTLDVLVNNYGTAGQGTWTSTSADDWRDLYEHNVLSVSRITQGLLPMLNASPQGRIINLGTIGSTRPNKTMPHYYAAKGALATLTAGLAKAVESKQLTVNLVSPGLIRTPEVEAAYLSTAQKRGWGETFEAAEEKITPQEIELYESVFSLLDLDGGGTIEEEELRVGLMAIGKNPTSEELSEMMRQVDEDESGEIDIAEFVKFMWLMKKEKAAKEEKEGGKEGGKEGEEEEEVMKMVIKEKTEEGEGVGKGKEKTATVAVAPAPDE